MYQVYANGKLLHDYSLDDYRLTAATLTLELGKTGSFEFTLYPNHPAFDSIVPMRSIVTVYKYSQLIYSGRVLNIQYGFYGEKQVSCEGVLAFLLDTMVEPHSYNGSFSDYLAFVLVDHNAMVDSTKRFTAGRVTVGEFSPFVVEEKEYASTFDLLNRNMVGNSGGYLHVREENGVRYLDLLSYTADVSDVSGQMIEVGKNLLDISRKTNSENVFSAIIPKGAKLEGSDARLDIKEVNYGLPYIVNETAREFCGGLIYREVIFDNITNAQTLKTTATNYLENNYAGESSIEITAADLSRKDPSIDSFWIGRWVRVFNQYHFTDGIQLFLIKKMTIDLLNPAGNKIVIGEVRKGLSDEVAQISDVVNSIEDPEPVQPYVIESGKTGIWTWKKFSDNTCEFFGKVPVYSADVTTALGGWYRGPNLYDATAYPYPVSMTEAPALNLTFQTRNGLAALLWAFSADADTAQGYLPQSYLIRPTTATGIYGNINIIGKGKLS